MTRRWWRRAAVLADSVDEHGRMLRGLSFDQLVQRSTEPTEHFEIEGRAATIHTIVEQAGSEVRVVVQGFVKSWIGSHVAIHSFYKARDGSLRELTLEEERLFD